MKESNKLSRHVFLFPLEAREDTGIAYFNFEEDFIEDNVRCIPMIVRFKLDACGIKLKLKEWSKMEVKERKKLTDFACATDEDVQQYRNYLQQLVFERTGSEATDLPVESNPAWANANSIPALLVEKLKEFNWVISLQQWRALSNLQRFVLMKLSKPGHEHKNFPIAVREFRLV